MRNGKFGYGIIGAGVIGPTHAWAVKELEAKAELIAIADIEEAKAAAMAKDFAGSSVYKDYKELLKNKDIDIVSVCVPSGLHGMVVKDAAKAGKHIVCEKPIEITLPKIDEMVKACKDAKVKLACIFQRRMQPESIVLKKKIASGAFGKIVTGSAYQKFYRSPEYYKSAGWRASWELDGGGALMNQCVHGIDLITWLMGGISSVNAICETKIHDIKVEDTSLALVRFKNGAVGVLEGTTSVYPGFSTRFEIGGEKGCVALTDSGFVAWDFKDEKEKPVLVGETKEGTASDNKAVKVSGHTLQIADIMDAIKENREPVCNGEEGRKAVEVILAIYKSAKEKKEIKLPL
ncbi:MAG: Gfo/Idh/MocA family oxidoreductase [Candidatus Firestonebacteria bacterium]